MARKIEFTSLSQNCRLSKKEVQEGVGLRELNVADGLVNSAVLEIVKVSEKLNHRFAFPISRIVNLD